jgi:hypothetical protein
MEKIVPFGIRRSELLMKRREEIEGTFEGLEAKLLE